MERFRKYEPGLRYRRWTLVDEFTSIAGGLPLADIATQHTTYRNMATKRIERRSVRGVSLDAIQRASHQANISAKTKEEFDAAFTELIESERVRAMIERGI